jgi:hypothetical protein
MINKIVGFLLSKKIQITPLLLSVAVLFCGYVFNVIHGGETCYARIGSVIYEDIRCDKVIGNPIIYFFTPFIISTIFLLFARSTFFAAWRVFFVFYLVISGIILLNISPTSNWFDRTSYALGLGFLLSFVTVTWVIIHSLIKKR